MKPWMPTGPWWKTSGPPAPAPLQYVLTGLTNGTQYDVQVRAVNSAGDGPWSATADRNTCRARRPERHPVLLGGLGRAGRDIDGDHHCLPTTGSLAEPQRRCPKVSPMYPATFRIPRSRRSTPGLSGSTCWGMPPSAITSPRPMWMAPIPSPVR